MTHWIGGMYREIEGLCTGTKHATNVWEILREIEYSAEGTEVTGTSGWYGTGGPAR